MISLQDLKLIKSQIMDKQITDIIKLYKKCGKEVSIKDVEKMKSEIDKMIENKKEKSKDDKLLKNLFEMRIDINGNEEQEEEDDDDWD